MDARMNAMDAKFDAILARLDRAPEHRSTSAEDAAAAKAAAEKAGEAKREQEAQEIDKEVKRLQQLARETSREFAKGESSGAPRPPTT